MRRIFGLVTTILLSVAMAACGGGDQGGQQGQQPATQQQAPAQRQSRGQPQQQMPGAQQGQQAEVSDKELRAFVQAQNQMRTASKEFAGRMQDAQGAQDSQKVRRDAQKRFDEIIQKTGLTVERYKQIARAIKSDRRLMKRYMKFRSQMEGGTPR